MEQTTKSTWNVPGQEKPSPTKLISLMLMVEYLTSGSLAKSWGSPYTFVVSGKSYALTAACADDTVELQRAVSMYLPLESLRYGRCAELAHDVVAVGDRPMIPTRIGAILSKTLSDVGN